MLVTLLATLLTPVFLYIFVFKCAACPAGCGPAVPLHALLLLLPLLTAPPLANVPPHVPPTPPPPLRRWGMGLMGAALAWDLTQGASLLMMASYCVYHTRRQAPGKCTWGGWTLEAFEGWGQYITMAIPSMVMICAPRGAHSGWGWLGWVAARAAGRRPAPARCTRRLPAQRPCSLSPPPSAAQAWTGGRLR